MSTTAPLAGRAASESSGSFQRSSSRARLTAGLVRIASLRRPLLDVVPAAVLTSAVLVAAALSPRLGGPTIGPSGETIDYDNMVVDALAWGIFSVLTALLVSRGRAVWLGAKGLIQPSPPFAAARRTLPRLLPRALTVVAGVIVMRMLMIYFISFKRAVPQFHPFGGMDPLIIRVERAMHFGIDPWRILQPVLGRPWITAAFDVVYYNWYLVTMLGFVSLAFWLRGARRMQFILSFVGAWVFLGILLATAMSSVGPCFMDRYFGGESVYTAQMAYLASVNQTYPLHALVLQNGLWDAYLNGSTGLVSGIAAMPSLHVALPSLFAVASWRRMRRLSIALWIYTSIIVLGSVHLAWHYALDGYVSIVLIFPLWAAAGRVATWWYGRTRAWRWGWAPAPDASALPTS